jgi:hypothetical protein
MIAHPSPTTAELRGSFIRNGPGGMDVYGTQLVHPIDGDIPQRPLPHSVRLCRHQGPCTIVSQVPFFFLVCYYASCIDLLAGCAFLLNKISSFICLVSAPRGREGGGRNALSRANGQPREELSQRQVPRPFQHQRVLLGTCVCALTVRVFVFHLPPATKPYIPQSIYLRVATLKTIGPETLNGTLRYASLSFFFFLS